MAKRSRLSANHKDMKYRGTPSDGTLEYMRENRLWHFDPCCTEVRYKVIGRFLGNWIDEINRIPFGEAKNLNNSMPHRCIGSVFDEVHLGNIKDSIACHYPDNLTYGRVYDQKKSGRALPKVFERMVNAIPLEQSYVKATKQRPGELWPFHFDNFHALRTDSDDVWADPGIRRIVIALEDWSWGHYYLFGNSVWHNWKAGEIVYFDWLEPHATANCGPTPRHTLFVTGKITSELSDWLKSGEYRQIDV